MKSSRRLLERNGKRWSYCHGNPVTCMIHLHEMVPHPTIDSLEEVLGEEQHYFHQSLDAKDYENKKESFLSNLTIEEMKTIAHYADSGFKQIHAMTSINQDTEHIKNLNSAMQKYESETLVLYRGIPKAEEYSIGDRVALQNYTSTTCNPHKAVEFTKPERRILLMFTTNKGAPISLVHNEMEFLLPQGSRYLVKNILYTDIKIVYPDTDYTVSFEKSLVYHLIDA
jgi:hypothetical protein